MYDYQLNRRGCVYIGPDSDYIRINQRQVANTSTLLAPAILRNSGDIRLNESGFRHIVNPNVDSAKNCILLTNLNPDSVNPAGIPFHSRREIGDEC